MSNEQKLASFMRKHGEQEAVARHYLTANNWALEQASLKYEADKEGSRVAISARELHSLQSLLSRHTRAREDEPEAYFGGASDSSVPQMAGGQSSKRVQIDDSTPALTTADSDRSLRAWGHGVRLGSAHPINPPPVRDDELDTDSELEENERSIVVLHLWSEGFTLDSGALRPYEVPENERFLRAIMRGDFPEEMQELGRRIELSVQDHTNESYRELSRKQFMGHGRPLSSPTLLFEPVAAVTTPLTPQEQQLRHEQDAQRALQLNDTDSTTTIQFRLANGNRIVAHFNTSHNVGDLYRYVRMARPQYSGENFMLITAFPRLELNETDPRTLAEADLLNVVVTQHIDEDSDPIDQSTD